MDGNKRWSENNKLNLKEGYLRGIDKIKEITDLCLKNNIEYLTLYALSSENINRKSISTIFEILTSKYQKILKEFDSQKLIKINIIGEKNNLPKNILNILDELEFKTKKNKKLNLNIAFNYGTDKEIISIVKKILSSHNLNKEKNITKLIKENMYLSNIPDPDLLIRTGGFQRLSNFLLLKLSYTELFFSRTLWPDLSKEEIINIFEKFSKIERKYGL